MISLYIDPQKINEERIEIEDKSEVNYLKNVHRIKIKNEVRVVDGFFEYLTKVNSIEKNRIVLEIIQKNEDRYTVGVEIDLAIGLLKNDKMELTIQKTSEIGINKIIPIKTQRTVVKIDEKKDRWDKLSLESLRQCRRVKPLIIDEICRINEIDFSHYDLILVPYEEEKEVRFKEIEFGKIIKKALYFIGPEGGFEEEEIKYIVSKGGKSLSLGPRILRAETAAIVVGGLLINEFDR